MKKLVGVVAVLCLLMFAVTVNAETQTQDAGKKDHYKAMKKERREKLLKALALDKDTSAKLTAVMDSYSKKRHEAMKSMKEDIKALREAVNGRKADAIKEALGKIEESHSAFKTMMESEKTEIKGILSDEQRAKFVLFMVDAHKHHRNAEKHEKPKE
ncbi:MAG: Spy/CpxP family protein refolding chaperone [Candidatus Magnetominusculus sp. LBB02]|nr:Spy/CpxP family protein refolding chaperone [Candidatus Magnetominusculus sp. LBB02]